MKRNIVLIFLVIVLACSLAFLHIFKTKDNTSLGGLKLNEYLYSYTLNPKDTNLTGTTIKDDYIYYLVDTKTTFELYKQNIYTANNIKIAATEPKDQYCSLEDEYITCSDATSFNLYNLEFKLLASSTYESEEFITFIPYQDTYLKALNNKLYSLSDSSLVKEIPQELFDFTIESFLKTKTTTYVLYSDYEQNIHYIYDIATNNVTKVNSKNSKKYDRGFYFYDSKQIIIYDLISNKTTTYPNYTTNDFFYTSTLSDNHLYLYDTITDNIFFLDLINNTIQVLTIPATKTNPINRLYATNNYLYLEILSDTNNFYLIDLNSVTAPKNDIETYYKTSEEKLNTYLSSLENEYHVKFHIKKDAIIDYPDFTAQVEDNNFRIYEALGKLETILKKFNSDFFDSFKEHSSGLNLYLTNALAPANYDTQIANPAAYSLTFNNEYLIVMDISQFNLEELLCHELMHNMEFNLQASSKIAFANWDTYNPLDFYYLNSYTKDSIFDYTLNQEDKNQVYFIDEYSHSFASEDRARIFEYVCTNQQASLAKYPNLTLKANYLQEEILNFFPALKTSSLFKKIN